MTATGVGPYPGERNLAGCPLLEEEAVLGVKEEDREGSVQETAVVGGVGEAMSVVFATMSSDDVGVIDQDAFVFEHQVFLRAAGAVPRHGGGGGGCRWWGWGVQLCGGGCLGLVVCCDGGGSGARRKGSKRNKLARG